MAFTLDEKMALIAILKGLVESEEINDAQLAAFDRLATSRGFNDFSRVFEETDRELSSGEDGLKNLLRRVKDTGARERIMQAAVDMARADGMVGDEETKILRTVAHEWKMSMRPFLH